MSFACSRVRFRTSRVGCAFVEMPHLVVPPESVVIMSPPSKRMTTSTQRSKSSGMSANLPRKEHQMAAAEHAVHETRDHQHDGNDDEHALDLRRDGSPEQLL